MTTETIFFNQVFDKKRLKVLIAWVLNEFGEEQALRIVEELKKIGFSNATQAGLSIGLNDLSTPVQKASLISKAEYTMSICNQDFNAGRITATERSQKMVDTWHRVSETLRKQVVDHFSTYDQLNPVYIMALSGARGNFAQVRQLVGMRGLMADPQGQIISFPIRSNLREGLTLTEYFISCSGARKGLVDTALRTADTGYLTRRLVDVAHHIVIKKVNCNTNKGLLVRTLRSENKLLLSLCDRLIGRVLAQDIKGLVNETKHKKTSKLDNTLLEVNDKALLAKKNQEICPTLAAQIQRIKDQVLIRSPLTCALPHSVCQLCYGWSLSQGRLVSLGEAVGVIAAQSIGEPGTQLTMRTFHTGGVFSGDLLHEIRAPHSGKVEFSKAFQGLLIRTADGQIAFLTKTPGEFILENNKSNDQVVLTSHKEVLSSKKQKKHNEQTVESQHDTMWWSNYRILQPFFITTKDDVVSMLYQRGGLIASVPKLLYIKELTIIRGIITRYLFSKKHSEKHKDYFALFLKTRQNIVNKNLPIILASSIANIKKNKKILPKVDVLIESYDQKILLQNSIRSCLLFKYKKITKNIIETNSSTIIDGKKQISKQTCLQFKALSLLFVRQSEYVRKNQLLVQISLFGGEGNQPIKTRQTVFAELSGKICETQGALNSKKLIKNIKKINTTSETEIYKYDIVDTLKTRVYDSIQPEKSEKLGFFYILATQIGATFDFNSFQLSFYEQNSIQNFCNSNLLDHYVNNKVIPNRLRTENRKRKRSVDKQACRFTFGRVQNPKTKNSKIQSSMKSSKVDFSELKGKTIKNFPTKSLQLKCVYNTYTAQFFSNTQNKEVVSSLVKRKLYKVKILELLPQINLNQKLPINIQKIDDFYLKTIAQEGDLVDSSYNNCSSSSWF